MSAPNYSRPNEHHDPSVVSALPTPFRSAKPRAEKRVAVSFDSRYPTPFRAVVEVAGTSPASALAALRGAVASAEAQLLEYAENDPETAA